MSGVWTGLHAAGIHAVRQYASPPNIEPESAPAPNQHPIPDSEFPRITAGREEPRHGPNPYLFRMIRSQITKFPRKFSLILSETRTQIRMDW